MVNKNLIFYLGLPLLLDIAVFSEPVLANDQEAFEYLLELPLEELVNIKKIFVIRQLQWWLLRSNKF